MGLTKKLQNGASIVLLYTRNFNWMGDKDPVISESVLPETGHVYRAIKDPSTGSYYVEIEQPTLTPSGHSVEGIRITELTYSNSEFECDMVELTDDNIIDFDISPEDYKKINTWVEDDHKSFIETLERKNGINVIVSKDDIPQASEMEKLDKEMVNEVGKKIMDALEKSTFAYENVAHESIQYIAERDPWMLETVTGLLVYISRILGKEDTGPTIPFSREISGSPELGKGANIYTAISAIENYINTNQKIGGNKNSLNKAIFHLLLEIIRLKNNNQ